MSGPVSIRFMKPTDLEAVTHLLGRVFPEASLSPVQWRKTLNWLYFTLRPGTLPSRALVIERKGEVIGHIGFTLSECVRGHRSFEVVHPVNWALAPETTIGLPALQLMLRVLTFGEVAVVIDGSRDTQRILPRLGFSRRVDVTRYIKIVRPGAFLKSTVIGHRKTAHLGKWGVFLIARTRERMGMFTVGTSRMTESGSISARTLNGNRSCPDDPFRARLTPSLLQWYQQCPHGDVHVVPCFTHHTVIGESVLLIKSSGRNRYATILAVQAFRPDVQAWIDTLDAAERFLQQRQITHINAIGTYPPWCRALEARGYVRLRMMPFWLRDRTGELAGVHQWHVMPIQGDVGYLFE